MAFKCLTLIIYDISIIVIPFCLLKDTLSKFLPQGALPILTMEIQKVIQVKIIVIIFTMEKYKLKYRVHKYRHPYVTFP